MSCKRCELQENACNYFDFEQAFCRNCRSLADEDHLPYVVVRLNGGCVSEVLLSTKSKAEAVKLSVDLMGRKIFTDLMVWNPEQHCYRLSNAGDFAPKPRH